MTLSLFCILSLMFLIIETSFTKVQYNGTHWILLWSFNEGWKMKYIMNNLTIPT